MADLSETDVRRVAQLCKLRLSEAEIDDARQRLAAVLTHMERLAALDLDDVEPMARASDEPARLRGDEPGAAISPDTLRAIAPQTFESPDAAGTTDDDGQPIEHTFIAVPKVLGDGGGA